MAYEVHNVWWGREADAPDEPADAQLLPLAGAAAGRSPQLRLDAAALPGRSPLGPLTPATIFRRLCQVCARARARAARSADEPRLTPAIRR